MNIPEDSPKQLDGQQLAAPQQPAWDGRAVLEIVLILVLFFVVQGEIPPDVNEAHYLAKAKHYWNPDWCSRDHFLQSDDAHVVFYWTFGWLTQWLSLTAVAWVGRLVVWTLLAISWFRLTRVLVGKPGCGLLTAAFYLLLLERADLSGEWVVGGLEAKGIAYGFVFLAMEAVIENRWRRGWVLLGAAVLFHVLVGGWATIAVGFAWLVAPAERCKVKAMLPFLIAGGCLALAGLIPAVRLSFGVSAAEVSKASETYVYDRLPHHLLPTNFSRQHVVSYMVMLFGWLAVLAFDRQRWEGPYRRLVSLVGGAVLIALVGWLLSLVFSHSRPLAASWLRYYWFRLGDALLPIGLIFAVLRVFGQWARVSPRMAAYLTAMLILAASCYVVNDFVQGRDDSRPAADRQTLPRAPAGPAVTQRIYQDWVHACLWIRTETPSDAIFITPRRQQTFKWYAQRAEVVNWKDVPQDAKSLIVWKGRMKDVYTKKVVQSGFASLTREQLVKLMREYDARYVVRPRFTGSSRLPLKKVYPPLGQESFYEVYELPQ